MSIEVQLTLDEAVSEVLNLLTGMDLSYDPEQDRYRVLTRQLNRALRANALDNEWGCYSTVLPIGNAATGEWEFQLPSANRPRIVNDDAVRLVDSDGVIVKWAYILPRDALHKYQSRSGLWCSFTRRYVTFSRPFLDSESGLEIQAPVMREPKMFRLPDKGRDVPTAIRNQLIDFPYPDVIVARAAYYYAQSDPVMQPRVQTLESDYKNLMYQLIERDTAHTDSPYVNEFILPVENGLLSDYSAHLHPHSSF